MEKTFEVVSGTLVCSDPCYEIPTWCQGIVNNVKKGTWVAEVIEEEDGCIALLSIRHKDVEEPDANITPMDFVGGVDSGQFGFFDKDFYRNDESAKDLPKYEFSPDFDKEAGDVWYRACCILTLGDERWGVLPNGVVSSSGYGDGSYDVYGAKNGDGEYVCFSVIFIYEEETCDECGDSVHNCEC